MPRRVPFKICFPLVDPTKYILLVKILVRYLSILHLTATIFNFTVHIAMIKIVKKSENRFQKKQKSNVTPLSRVIIVTISNFFCWVPNGVTDLLCIRF